MKLSPDNRAGFHLSGLFLFRERIVRFVLALRQSLRSNQSKTAKDSHSSAALGIRQMERNKSDAASIQKAGVPMTAQKKDFY